MARDAVGWDRREFLLGLVVLGIIAPLCIVAAEVALRVVAPVPFESAIRLEMTQNLPGLAREFVYEQNPWGYRSLSMQSLEKPPNTVRVLVLGGSTTKQDTQSTEDTWTGILETKLNSALKGQAHVEVLALGGSGKTAGSRVSALRKHVARVDPDLLITLEGVNDLVWNGLPDYRYAGPQSFQADPGAERLGALARCRQRFQLCRRLKILRDTVVLEWAKLTGRALEWHSEHLGELRATYQALPFVPEPTRDPDPFAEFDDAVAAMLAHASESDLPAIVLGQPVLWKEDMSEQEQAALWFWVGTPEGKVRPSTGWLRREMRRYNAAQRARAESHGFQYIELDGRLPRDLDHFFDDCHLTDQGSRRQAEIVFPKVLDEVRAILAGRRVASGTG